MNLSLRKLLLALKAVSVDKNNEYSDLARLHEVTFDYLDKETLRKLPEFDQILSQNSRDEGLESYLYSHAMRLHKTFEVLRTLNLPAAPRVILDAGTWVPYLGVLQQIFPDYFFSCISHAVVPASMENVSVTNLDLEKDVLPLKDESVSLVIFLECIEHFKEDPMFFLAEANRVLVNGGYLVMTTPNIASWRSLMAVLHNYSPYLFGSYVIGDPYSHKHEYCTREVRTLLSSAGFDHQVSTENFYFKEKFQPLQKFVEQAGFSTLDRGDTIIAIAKKIAPVKDRYPVELYWQK